MRRARRTAGCGALAFSLACVGSTPGQPVPIASSVTSPVSSPVDRTVTVLGVPLHYLDWGGSGAALVLLPPICETAHIYGDIAPAFADRFRVLGPTTRGCGRSGRADRYDIDVQLRELEGFLDALQIDRTILVGFSASGGKAIRFARLYPARVEKLVIFDPAYSFVAAGLEEQMGKAIARLIGGNPDRSAYLYRRSHEAWELGAWSATMDRNLRETHETAPDGMLRSRGAPEWWTAFRADMKAGRYFETRLSHPALMFFAVDLDQERVKRLDASIRATLEPLARETDRRRREQIDEFRRNGLIVRIIEMAVTAHYVFVHKPPDVIREMRAFLDAGASSVSDK